MPAGVLSSKPGALSVPTAMLSDEYLKDKLMREMTHQTFAPPEQIDTAKAVVDMLAQEAVGPYGVYRAGEDMMSSLGKGDLGWAALSGLGLLPGIPAVASMTRDVRPVSDAIGLSSPSGKMSKASLKRAQDRVADQLFGPESGFSGFGTGAPPQPGAKEALLRKASELRDLASRGMSVRKFTKEAARLEAEAAAL